MAWTFFFLPGGDCLIGVLNLRKLVSFTSMPKKLNFVRNETVYSYM